MIDNHEKACYSDSRVTNAGEKARIHVVFDILVPEYRTSANLVRLYRRKENMKKENLFVILTGVVIGIAALVLTALGNPANMGFCIACFERDIAGAVGLHSAAKVQYVRPEIIGLVLGSFLMALASKEWKARAGSSPALRFVLGAFVMIGALAFLGWRSERRCRSGRLRRRYLPRHDLHPQGLHASAELRHQDARRHGAARCHGRPADPVPGCSHAVQAL